MHQHLEDPKADVRFELKTVNQQVHLHAQLDAAMSMWKYYRGRCSAAEQRLDRKRREHEAVAQDLRERIGQLESQCSALKSHTQRLEHQLQAMLNSRSWRLTSPYRKLGSIMRHIVSIIRARIDSRS